MSYQRVIPRDLFNESKHLKCLGRLCLLIHEGVLPGLQFDHDGTPFRLEQDPTSGDVYAVNVRICPRIEDPDVMHLTTPVNCREPWPLYWTHPEVGEIPVFEDTGEISPAFELHIPKRGTP